MSVVQLADVIVPEVFDDYTTLRSFALNAVIASGALEHDARFDQHLAGPGRTFNIPYFKFIDDSDAENVATDNPADIAGTSKIGTIEETQVRCERNKAFNTMSIVRSLIGADPMASIGNSVADYWSARIQAMFLATAAGVVANNASATDAYHTQNDMVHDISGLTGGAEKMSTSAFIDTQQTLGDHQQDLTLVCMHSIVYASLRKLQLIDFVADATNPNAISIPYYNGRRVIVDDTMPHTGGIFDTYLFGTGAFRMGMIGADRAIEFYRAPFVGNGSGSDTMFTRKHLCIHPCGYAWVGGASVAGGPSNAATSGNLANAASWQRVFPHKMVAMAVLRTKEY